MTAPAETVVSSCELPAVGPDMREQTPRVPAWITDPDVIESIRSRVYEIPDDLCGGAR